MASSGQGLSCCVMSVDGGEPVQSALPSFA